MRLAHRPGSSRLRVGAAPTGWAAARAPPVHCSLLGGLSDPTRGPPPESFSVGQQVTVIESVNFMHVPGHKGGFDAKGLTGKVLRVYAQGNLSANREIKVEFAEPKKWIGHFEPWEVVAG